MYGILLKFISLKKKQNQQLIQVADLVPGRYPCNFIDRAKNREIKKLFIKNEIYISDKEEWSNQQNKNSLFIPIDIFHREGRILSILFQ